MVTGTTSALRFGRMEECPPLVAVVFPAIVTRGTTTFRSSKVFLAADRAYIAIDTPSGPRVSEVVSGSVAVLGNDTFEITPPEGETTQVRKGGGCGCGSRLKTWSPFSGPLRVGT